MSTTETKEPPVSGFSLFWLAYGQVAAILGAISLIVIAGHFVDFGLKGVVQQTVEWWIENVRPLFGAIFQGLINLLPEGWRFELHDFFKDYLVVGIILILSAMRVDAEARTPRFLLGTMPLLLIMWPYWIWFVIFPVTERTNLSEIILWLAPLIYMALILLLNSLL
jgi:hypothetical protein